MNRTICILSAFCAFVPVFAGHSAATAGQNGRAPKYTPAQGMMGGWHYDSMYGRQYFSGTEVTVRGTITDIGAFMPLRGMRNGSRIILKTDKGNVTVHLGPYWYIDAQDLKLEKGQSIEVEGRQIGSGKEAFIIASAIIAGKEKLSLRDSAGIPNWCAMRPYSPPTPRKEPQEKSP
ncbi:MAG: hypothetical protein EBR09_09910 [Proteobacteria bacterium]|nr:hypothetical protein [Pseudomonadota bacterium]